MPDLAETIVGVSPSMVALRAYLPKVAQSRATVLITGATGSGKERIAQAIHAIGPRALRPFVPINCATLPDGLIESELFGHERGAFTGAVAASRGQILHADGGTLFLDEIGEMHVHTQAKLLRVLEAREVRPVGAGRPISVDVRVIAATNQPLEALVAQSEFRSDLYYRLNVVRLDLPPLKDRPEDIPELFRYAITQMNARERRHVGLPDAELVGTLMAHDWPGNVRELNNLVEAIFVDPPEGEIGLRHLPPAFRQVFANYRFSPDIERTRLISALEDTNWNKAEAAKRLNWSRMTLYRKMSLYRLDRSA
jgi:DNA-binding NtrC family response regulator